MNREVEEIQSTLHLSPSKFNFVGFTWSVWTWQDVRGEDATM